MGFELELDKLLDEVYDGDIQEPEDKFNEFLDSVYKQEERRKNIIELTTSKLNDSMKEFTNSTFKNYKLSSEFLTVLNNTQSTNNNVLVNMFWDYFKSSQNEEGLLTGITDVQKLGVLVNNFLYVLYDRLFEKKTELEKNDVENLEVVKEELKGMAIKEMDRLSSIEKEENLDSFMKDLNKGKKHIYTGTTMVELRGKLEAMGIDEELNDMFNCMFDDEDVEDLYDLLEAELTEDEVLVNDEDIEYIEEDLFDSDEKLEKFNDLVNNKSSKGIPKEEIMYDDLEKYDDYLENMGTEFSNYMMPPEDFELVEDNADEFPDVADTGYKDYWSDIEKFLDDIKVENKEFDSYNNFNKSFLAMLSKEILTRITKYKLEDRTLKYKQINFNVGEMFPKVYLVTSLVDTNITFDGVVIYKKDDTWYKSYKGTIRKINNFVDIWVTLSQEIIDFVQEVDKITY